MEHMVKLREVFEQRHFYRQPTTVAFLDIRSALDSIDNLLYGIVCKSGVPENYTSILGGLYNCLGKIEG